MSEQLLSVQDLKKYFPVRRGLSIGTTGVVRAVDGVSFTIPVGRTLGLVGESGSGKSTLGRAILRLVEPTAGRIEFDGANIVELRGEALRRWRRDAQIIFQDPYASLNPRMTVGRIVSEAFAIHGLYSRSERAERVRTLLHEVGLKSEHATRHPHEFSGGQRQRVGIARGIALRPRFVVCDEPVSALDVSIQAQIVNLLKALQQRHGLSYLFIAHDLGVVRHISDRIAVMYLGKLVEIADRDQLIDRALHPYTQALLSAIPHPEPKRKRDRIVLSGDLPAPTDPPPGCRFHTRCPLATERCRTEEPPLTEYAAGHFAACHYVEEHGRPDIRAASGC